MRFQKGHTVPPEWREKIKLARAKQIITDETKKKISKALKGRLPWNKGKKMPEDFRKKIRERMKLEWQKPEIREKRLKGMRGRRMTDEIKKKIGESNKKKWQEKSLEEKQKFKEERSRIQKELLQNQEYKNKLVKSHIGKIGFWRNKRRPEIAGVNCHLWEGGRTKLTKQIRDSVEYKKWRREVFERDNFTCQICGNRGCQIQADHYPKSFSQILKEYNIKDLNEALKCKELWDTNNGRTLCLDCHKKTDNFLKREKLTGKQAEKVV
jgi:5-methylcytosine-specific restriction endonuclease McrA